MSDELPQKASDASVPTREQRIAEMERLKAQGEKAYDEMYDAHYSAKWEYEMAYESLSIAADIARELGLAEEAQALDARREHIRNVYDHQFRR